MAKFSVEEVSPIERRIKVEVPPEVVASELEQAYRQLSRKVKIPGFRPGHIPRRILEARFKDQVETDVVQHLVAHSYQEAVIANPSLMPVAPPRVTDTAAIKPGEPFRYQAQVDVKPKVEPKDVEGLEIKQPSAEVPESQVDEEIEKLRQSMAEMAAVEGRDVAQDGDFAVVDFEGTADGKPFPGSKAQNAMMEVSPGEFTEGHAPQLAGLKVGESRELTLDFPADYRVEALKGKQAKFQVKLSGLKTRKIPALDDAFAKDIGAGESLAQLKERIRTELTSRAKEKADRELRDQVVAQLVQRNPFEVPRSMVEAHIDRMIESFFERFARQGINPRQLNADVDRMRDGLREQATNDIKGALLLEAIAEQQKIEATDADLDAKVKEMAEKLKAPEDRVRSYLAGEEGARGMRYRIREEKTLAFLTSKAKIS